jgi:hypothetical protein
MNVRSLIAALLAQSGGDVDMPVYLCPNVQPVDAVEFCPGDPAYGLDPYITIHSDCRYPNHGQQTLDEAS